MGLDMYVYKIGKISDEISEKLKAKPVHADSFRDDFGVSGICADCYDESLEGSLFPFFTKVRVIKTFWDMEKVWRDYQIPEGCRYDAGGGWSSGYTEFYFCNGKSGDEYESMTVKIPESEESKYLFDKEGDIYVFTMEEVAYWRKNYPLFRWLKAHLLETCEKHEDCQYFPVDDEMRFMMEHLNEIAKKPELFDKDDYCTPANYLEYEQSMKPVTLSPGEGLFYFPWW